MHAPLSSSTVDDEALESELLLLHPHLLCSPAIVSPLPADEVLSSINDSDDNDLTWLLPLIDSDILSSSSSTSASASPSASSSPRLNESTPDAEFLVSSHLTSELASDDCTSSSSSSCASPLERSDNSLDSFDAWSPHPQHPLIPPSTAAAAVARALTHAKKPVFASTHARQKHEKKALTHEALALEATLERLQARAGAYASSTQSLARKSALVASPAPSSHSAWTHVAATERTLLQRSTRTNKRLRERIQEHKRLSKRLQRMLLDRTARAALLSEQLFRPSSFSCSATADLSPLDIVRLRDMMRELDHLRATADAALDALEAGAPAHGSYRHWHAVQSDAGTPACLRVVSCDEVPFTGSQITRALERYRKRTTPGYGVLDPQRFDGPRDVLVVEEVGGAFAPLGAPRYRHRRASQSFTHGARAVTVSVGCIESVDARGHATPDVRINVQMWIIGREHTHVNASTGERECSTTIQNVTTLTPVTVSNASMCVRTGGAPGLVDSVLMPLWDREVATRVQQLENLLVTTHIHA